MCRLTKLATLLVIGIVLLTSCVQLTESAIWRHGKDLQQPSEVLPIQPVQIYPVPVTESYQARILNDEDDNVIYIKLLKSKMAYRPKKQNQVEENMLLPRDLMAKDIIFVKALVNGAFSDQRLKVFRVPQFYAINVFHQNSK